ncbi:MAG TPA: RidA family protein [Longimicrobiaceae bacterium]|nr:RidA family protein [Longimicrobiaceae bacterium]
MTKPRIVHTDVAPAAIGPYSQAVVYGGLVYTAGQIALDPDTGELAAGDVAAQTERVLRNLQAVLEAAGSTLAGVLKTTVFLRDMDDFGAMNEVYGRFFDEHRPARSTVEAARLPRDCAVEIECVAALGQAQNSASP